MTEFGSTPNANDDESGQVSPDSLLDGAAGTSAAQSEPAPIHEKVEGYDRVEDVPLAAPPAGAQSKDSAAKTKPAKGGRKSRLEKSKEPKVEKPKRERRRITLLDGFKDPVRRPRYLIWALVAVLGLAAVMIVALGVTSTRWFCAEACHKVQDDSIIAYERSSHSEISCMACHMPVGANPVVFILHKAEALGELYLTVRNDFELPLNGSSHVALTMGSRQCTQCHNPEQRVITATEGIIIDHAVHADHEISCTICHNRVAHREDFELTLTDPGTGEPNRPHDQFSSMTACFRCHTQGRPVAALTAPGTCSACHPEGFELKPESHFDPNFFPKGHGQLGKAEAAKVASATAGAAEGAEHSKAAIPGLGAETAVASAGGDTLGMSLPSVATINECYTCHAEKFCNDCHGAPMPHPGDFIESHGEFGRENPKACVQCHGPVERFCDDCHHTTSLDRTYDQSRTWLEQHDDAAKDVGASACLDCHEPTYCAKCHVGGVN